MIPWLASEGKVISGEMSSSEEKRDCEAPSVIGNFASSSFEFVNVYTIDMDN